jgi:L-amino acid N-acyltransferase YncA
VPTDTGLATILVHDGGAKTMVLAPGANDAFSEADAENLAKDLQDAPEGSVLVVDNELSSPAIEAALEAARHCGRPTVLDPTRPARVTDRLLELCDHVTPNAVEAARLSGIEVASPPDAKRAAQRIRERGARHVHVRLPGGGCLTRLRHDRLRSGWMSLVLRELTEADVPSVEGWFRDSETQRSLGDETWPRQLIRLASLSADRFAYAAVEEEVVVGIADAERYADGRAAIALVVSPVHRRLGVGKAMARALGERPKLARVVEFFGGVEAGNLASAALVTGAGFEQVTDEPDKDGCAYFALRRDGRRPGHCGRCHPGENLAAIALPTSGLRRR